MANPTGVNQYSKGGRSKAKPAGISEARKKRFEADTRQAQFKADQAIKARVAKANAGHARPGSVSKAFWAQLNKPFGPPSR
jgi:hypothetical protein